MSHTYNLAQSRKLLHVDTKTFDKWLAKAKITPEQDAYDTRQKLLTYEQLVMLAELHKRPRPPLPEEREPVLADTALDKRLAALEQEMIRRFDQVIELLASLDQRITQAQGSQVKTVQHPVPASPVPRPSPAKKPQSTRKPAKKTKAKELPRGFIPLSVFKSEHGISDKAVEYAMEKQKLTVKRGKWQYDGRNVLIALDAQGRWQFYELFYERPGFQRCEKCPHAL